MNWTAKDAPSQQGKTILITGANAGLGYQNALELARKGARVVLAGRSQEKLAAACEMIRAEVANANLETGVVDLSNLRSVAEFAATYRRNIGALDTLINNAGVMFPPAGTTADGFETQLGTNFIGHFALTGLLIDLLKAQPDSRIVTLSSIAHRGAVIDFGNLKLEKPYDKFREYGQSKLADLIFAIELQRRIDVAGLDILSLGAHPGISKTELLRHDNPAMIESFNYMPASQGALPALFAATSPDVRKAGYYGPDGENEVNGYPDAASISAAALDVKVGKSLWDYAMAETNINYP